MRGRSGSPEKPSFGMAFFVPGRKGSNNLIQQSGGLLIPAAPGGDTFLFAWGRLLRSLSESSENRMSLRTSPQTGAVTEGNACGAIRLLLGLRC